MPALGLLLSSFVLNDIPVFDENPIFQANHVRRDPVHPPKIGGAGGVRAVENLRLVMGEIKIADVRAQVALSMWTDFENFTTFKPHEQHDEAVHLMADEVIAWGTALKAIRTQ